MKKVLITGGSGAVGAAFIKAFHDQYQFFSYSRNKEKQIALKNIFSQVTLYEGSVEDYLHLQNIFMKIKPDIVIHAAALKHIDTSEKYPSQAIKINLLGSLNVIEASRATQVPITIGMSSDKACLSNSVYGHTKNLMERLFLEANNEKNKFSCCRLSNVAGSVGSVIPFWLMQAQKKQALKITDPNMNRFMLLPEEVANLIQKAIFKAQKERDSFVLTKKIKAVNIFELANQISSNTEITEKRFGERLNETLVSTDELPLTYLDQEYIFIQSQKNPLAHTTLVRELNSLTAEKMNQSELKNLIKQVKLLYEGAY